MYNRLLGNSEPNHPDFRACICINDTTTELMGHIYDSLALDRNAEKLQPRNFWMTHQYHVQP